MIHRNIHAMIPLILLVALSAAAQPATSPHGDITIDCRICHGDASWEAGEGPLAFDHATTGFELRGAHTRIACEFCHPTLVFSQVGVMCADCHVDAHQGSLGYDCEQCHDERGWENRAQMRDRHDTTAFPLRGAHRTADCAACHRGLVETQYAATPVDCIACHLADYNATTEPAHAAAGFDLDCTLCHDPFGASWTGHRFLHPVSFPLTGAHATTDCISCHAAGYVGTSIDCYACHQADYDGTTDPAHQATGFPTTCTDCHDTRAWEPADWDHDTLFPIYSGKHRGEWSDCRDCHVTSTDYSHFECIYCHEHGQSETDRHHDEVRNYAYLSSACFECHPRGVGDD